MKAYLLVLALLLVFTAGCTNVLTGFFVNVPRLETQLVNETNVTQLDNDTAAPLLLDGVQETDEPVFVNLSLAGWDDKRAIIEGGLVGSVDGNVLAGLPIRILCDYEIVGEGTTDSEGRFSIITTGYCYDNLEAWAEVDYDDNKYESERLQLQGYSPNWDWRSSRGSPQLTFVQSTEVPEFSMIGAGIALLAGIMVLASRRDH